jgi:molecular chaperone DnaK
MTLTPTIGIDLGTTFCAISYVDNGKPRVIADDPRDPVTPSVVWFDGHQAWAGKKANDRKFIMPSHVREFVKQDIGKPVENTPEYHFSGYKYGAAGMSAILLRYLKKQALRHFRQAGLITETDDTKVALPAVITVPASFGEIQKRETRLAGHAAGLDVVGMIHEPTAAALAFGLTRDEDQIIVVVDLGGGTFDVTVLQMRGGEAAVLATRGRDDLGGRNFDELIQRHLLEEARRRTGIEVDQANGFEIQRLAIQAKHALSSVDDYAVTFSHAGQDLDIVLHRARTAVAGQRTRLVATNSEAAGEFYFEERSRWLLELCREFCEAVREAATITTASGKRPLEWNDVNEIVLAGGSCKMPMVATMLERLTGLRIRRQIDGFSYDTAISVGAALYGAHRERVRDVLPHGLGVKLERNGRHYVDFIIKRDTPIPTEQPAAQCYEAPSNAMLEVYEGDSEDPDLCTFRGSLELENLPGMVKIAMAIDQDGLLTATVDLPSSHVGAAHRKQLEIRNDLFDFRERAAKLRAQIQSLTINM